MRTTEYMNVLIASAAGYGNLGDDSIRDALSSTLKRLYPNMKISHTNPPPKKEAVEWADLTIVGGGGLLYDSDFANVVNYMSYIEWAHELGKPSIALGVGVQGISTEEGKRYYQRALNRANLVTTRDRESRGILINLVRISTPIQVCADLSFLLDLRPNRDHAPKDEPTLGICIRDFSPEFPPRNRYLGSIFDGLNRVRDRFKLIFFSFSRDDLGLTRNLHREFENSDFYEYSESWSPKDFLSLMNQCDLMVCTRYHAFIFSILLGIPALPIIELGGKIRWLASLIDHIPYSCVMDTLTADEFLKKLNDVWRDREKIKANFEKWKPELQARAYRNVELLASFIPPILQLRGDVDGY